MGGIFQIRPLFRIIRKATLRYYFPLLYIGERRREGGETIIRADAATSFRTRTNTSDKYAVMEVFFRKEYGDLKIGERDVILDIGANIGAFSVYCAQRASLGRVISYEALPANFGMLLKNAKLNGLPNIRARNLAVWDRSTRVRLPVGDSYTGVSIFRKEKRAVGVRTTTLEEIFRKERLSRVDVMKLDVEGAEYEIIAGAPAGLLERIRTIVLEYHDGLRPGKHRTEIEARLRGAGFAVRVKNRSLDNLVFDTGLIYATRPRAQQIKKRGFSRREPEAAGTK